MLDRWRMNLQRVMQSEGGAIKTLGLHGQTACGHAARHCRYLAVWLTWCCCGACAIP